MTGPARGGKATVRFLPQDVSVRVDKGSTLLHASQQANLYVRSLCGGEGICGKCKVEVTRGTVERTPSDLLTPEEAARGVVLACQTRVLEDVEVVVPQELNSTSHILVSSEEQRSPLAEEFPFDPLLRKVLLSVDAASVDNNVADCERFCGALGRALGAGAPLVDIDIVRKLPAALRASEGRVTATVFADGSEQRVVDVEGADTTDRHYALAVDVGTTTVVACLIDLASNRLLASEATYNSQMRYGEDYIQRIMYVEAHDALPLMQKLVVGDLNGLINLLTQRTGIAADEIRAVVCAGNTAMMHLLYALDPRLIRKSPYIPTANAIPLVEALRLGLKVNPRAPVLALDSVAAYVGADITAGVVATGLYRCDGIGLLVDLGTNGEVVLASGASEGGWLVCASSSAGPAFEGGGVTCGMRATTGAIERLRIGPGEEVDFDVVDDGEPKGICGSGLLDTLGELFKAGLLNRNGKLNDARASSRLRLVDDEWQFVLHHGTNGNPDVVITQTDITHLIRSKAGVYAAISKLTEAMQVDVRDLSYVFLAGGFGNSLDVGQAVTIGMLPDVPTDRIHFVGNTSLQGATLALVSRSAYQKTRSVGSSMTYFDLMSDASYMDEFIRANFLPHTDVERFPSVRKAIT